MQKKKKMVWIVIAAAAAVVLAGVILTLRLNRDFDAKGYVGVFLDYTFRGATDRESDVFADEALAQLENQYEGNVITFVDKNITSGIEVEEQTRQAFISLCKDIFKEMKYSVKEVEKISADEYKVTVEYRAADVFVNYRRSALQEAARIMDKVQKGDYQGESAEAIDLQMRKETIDRNYELLTGAYQDMQYKAKKDVVFTVKRGEDGVFSLDSGELGEFLVKIFGLDEIQD